MSGIGSFAIGETGIGQPLFDWRATVLSQYASSPTTLTLLDAFSQAVDQTVNIDAFYDMVWNVQTAEG